MSHNEIIQFTPTQLSAIDGYIRTTVPERFRERILTEAENSNKPYDNQVIGFSKRQAKLVELKKDDEWLKYLKNIAKAFAYQFKTSTIDTSNLLTDSEFIDSLEQDMPWVNKMSRTEFNPYHKHRGIYSYVIWLKIPYDYEEEKKHFPYSDMALTSCFCFMTACDRGLVQYPIPVDKSYEWELILFPATLQHCVYPFFTSDKERISIAGNLLYKP